MNNSIAVEFIQILKESLVSDNPILYIAKHTSNAWYALYKYIENSEFFSDMTPLEGFTFILLVLESENSENS